MPFPLAAIPIIGSIAEKGMDLIDKFVLDKDQAAAAKHELEKLLLVQQAEYLKVAAAESQAQSATNQIEAASSSMFVAGWRPAIGWVCALGFTYNFVIYPMAEWYAAVYFTHINIPPQLDGMLWELTAGMLGLSAIRTWEKLKAGGASTTTTTTINARQ
jgi:hypothetical protein